MKNEITTITIIFIIFSAADYQKFHVIDMSFSSNQTEFLRLQKERSVFLEDQRQLQAEQQVLRANHRSASTVVCVETNFLSPTHVWSDEHNIF